MPAGTAPTAATPATVSTQAPTVRELGRRRSTVFLDYDGPLTPMVARPQDAVMPDGMREVIQALAQRCPVNIVSGRDRPVVKQRQIHRTPGRL